MGYLSRILKFGSWPLDEDNSSRFVSIVWISITNIFIYLFIHLYIIYLLIYLFHLFIHLSRAWWWSHGDLNLGDPGSKYPLTSQTKLAYKRQFPSCQDPMTWSRVTPLTHWGRMAHICVSKLTNIGSDNGLSPGRRQAIIWTNAGILLIGPLGTNFNETSIEIHTFSFKKIHLKLSSGKWRPFCLGHNVLKSYDSSSV